MQQASAAATHEQTQAFHDTVTIVNDLRDKLANFDDQFRPLRNYFYWEPHCFDIPMCAALRSVFDSLDGISKLSDQFGQITASLDKLDALQPQLLALLPPQIAIQERNRDLTLSNYATTAGTNTQSRGGARATRPRWDRRSTTPRTTTRSTCRRKRSTTPTSSVG